MSDNITLQAVARVVEQIVKTELDPVKQTLTDNRTLLRSHSDSLEKLLSKKKIQEDETLIASDSLEVHRGFLSGCRQATQHQV